MPEFKFLPPPQALDASPFYAQQVQAILAGYEGLARGLERGFEARAGAKRLMEERKFRTEERMAGEQFQAAESQADRAARARAEGEAESGRMERARMEDERARAYHGLLREQQRTGLAQDQAALRLALELEPSMQAALAGNEPPGQPQAPFGQATARQMALSRMLRAPPPAATTAQMLGQVTRQRDLTAGAQAESQQRSRFYTAKRAEVEAGIQKGLFPSTHVEALRSAYNPDDPSGYTDDDRVLAEAYTRGAEVKALKEELKRFRGAAPKDALGKWGGVLSQLENTVEMIHPTAFRATLAEAGEGIARGLGPGEKEPEEKVYGAHEIRLTGNFPLDAERVAGVAAALRNADERMKGIQLLPPREQEAALEALLDEHEATVIRRSLAASDPALTQAFLLYRFGPDMPNADPARESTPNAPTPSAPAPSISPPASPVTGTSGEPPLLPESAGAEDASILDRFRALAGLMSKEEERAYYAQRSAEERREKDSARAQRRQRAVEQEAAAKHLLTMLGLDLPATRPDWDRAARELEGVWRRFRGTPRSIQESPTLETDLKRLVDAMTYMADLAVEKGWKARR